MNTQLQTGDTVRIINYLGVIFDDSFSTVNSYSTYCKCKEAEQNTFQIMEFADDCAVVRCITADQPVNLLVHLGALVRA